MEIDDNDNLEQKIIELESDPNVEYAEPNYIRHQLFNDTYTSNLW
jgi:hypothetical protein